MTFEDFGAAAKVKVDGTRNLHSTFGSRSLDFFIMLSSVSGVFGTSGQANYAAGNAFQDAFANAKFHEGYPYLSLNLGFIQETKAVDKTRVRNFMRHGIPSMTITEVLLLLEYAMSPKARKDHSCQIITGFNIYSLAKAEISNTSIDSPFFSHVRNLPGVQASEVKSSATQTFKEVITAFADMREVHQAITGGISRKLANLTAVETQNRENNLSMTELGLDSLSTTELKNWIGTEFQAAVQVSEILDQANVPKLALLVASRSNLVRDHEKSISGHAIAERKQSDVSNVGSDIPSAQVAKSSALPQLPLPDLSSSLNLYLESRRFFLTEQALSKTSTAVSEFLQKGGIGRTLQDRLESRYRDPKVKNWLLEPYTKKIYLERRDPVHPTGIFYGSHLITSIPHQQAERAAVLATAALQFKTLLEAGKLKPDSLNDEPMCMESLYWLFNAVRQPRKRVDQILRSPGHSHLIAMRHGHLYKVPVAVCSEVPLYPRLRAAFGEVLARSQNRVTSVSVLTADARDTWAEVGTLFIVRVMGLFL